MSNIQFIRFEKNQILVRFEGITRNITDEEEKVDEIIGACKMVKEDPTEDNKGYLKGLLNPMTKADFNDNLEIDQKGNLYLKDTKEPMPESLSSLLKMYVDNGDDITSFINFWKLCLANPNKVARDGFYTYVKDYGIVITDYGYVILYKAVNKTQKKEETVIDKSFSQYVSSQYLNIKGMKKSPKNYHVFCVNVYDEDVDSYEEVYKISTHKGIKPNIGEKDEILKDLGVLHDLYKEVIEVGKEMIESDERVAVYKPWHSGSHGMEIKLGVPVTMPRDKCDPDINVSCSYGLHVGSHKYVHSFGSGMDSILAVLVNPKDVVALPEYDHSKIRVCRYFPYAEIERRCDGSWEELTHGYFEEDFIDYDVEEIKERLKHLYEQKAAGEEIDTEEETSLNRRLIILENETDWNSVDNS